MGAPPISVFSPQSLFLAKSVLLSLLPQLPLSYLLMLFSRAFKDMNSNFHGGLFSTFFLNAFVRFPERNASCVPSRGSLSRIPRSFAPDFPLLLVGQRARFPSWRVN